MGSTSYMVIIIVLLFLLYELQRRMMLKKLLGQKGGIEQMREIAEKFVDKECVIYTYGSSQITGVIKEVTDGAVLLEKNGELEGVNLEFVVRIREYPRKKNGKKKSVIID